MSTLSIGVSGLNAAMVGLTTTSHNIANVSTDGYNRQVIVQESNFSLLTGSGFVGQGTHVETVKRIYSQFLSQQVLSAQTSAAEMDSYSAQISQIDNVLANTSSGLGSALSGFFSGIQAVAADPSSIPARQSMLSTAQTLVARFHSLDQRMSEIRSGVNGQITSEVSSITSYASQIADINERILLAQAGSDNQQPNDLLDQRDRLISELNQHVQVTTLTQSDGTVNVFFGNGQPLVVGTDAYSLGTEAAADDPERMVVVIRTPGGTSIQVPESQITGGTLGGLISFRSESLDSAQNALGRIAISLAQTFNNQHQLGQDLTGTLGEDFFSVSGPTVYSSTGSTGSLTATFSSSAATDLKTSDYQLAYNGGIYTLTRLSDNYTWSGASLTTMIDSDGNLAAEGFDLSGTPAAGDTFKIEPTRAGASSIGVVITDTRNIAAAAPMRTAADVENTGTGSISSGSVNSPAPPDANLQQTVTITFVDATHFNVSGTGTGNPTGVAYTSGDPITYNGWTIQISGAPASGDVFTVERNASGVADSRNAVALAALQTTDTMIGGSAGTGGTASYLEAYAQLVSEVGNKTREVNSIGESQQALADTAIATQQAMSGVNLDEEAANLIRFQQAYQASAKVIEISSKLFDSILALG
jgi:flagellar hook-associated protein 1 FlgK